MLALLREAWLMHSDQRLGQVVGNAARDPGKRAGDDYRDPFNVEDDEVWAGLRAIVRGDPFGKEGREP
jgi:hypothetical protein